MVDSQLICRSGYGYREDFKRDTIMSAKNENIVFRNVKYPAAPIPWQDDPYRSAHAYEIQTTSLCENGISLDCRGKPSLCRHDKAPNVRSISVMAPSNVGSRYQIWTLELIKFKLSLDAEFWRDLILSRLPEPN
ncbi:hypothetical protein TNCV_2311961 [Trichonephila clavipes]|nr:hypothetical protein TNCV_2311961 [Trichonephila clavipes]